MLSVPQFLGALALLLAATGGAGVVAGVTIDAWLNLRDIARETKQDLPVPVGNPGDYCPHESSP